MSRLIAVGREWSDPLVGGRIEENSISFYCKPSPDEAPSGDGAGWRAAPRLLSAHRFVATAHDSYRISRPSDRFYPVGTNRSGVRSRGLTGVRSYTDVR